MLTATPVLVSYRVRRLRDQLSDGSDAGRVIVNDFEAAFMRQLLVQERGRRGDGDGAAQARRDEMQVAALNREHRDEISLDSVARRIGPDAVERFAELRTLANSWHSSVIAAAATSSGPDQNSAMGVVPPSAADDNLNSRAEEVLSSAQSFDNYLRDLSLAQRSRIRELVRWNMISAIILAPLALAAALALFWTGRRILFFANAAERDGIALSHAMTSRAVLVRGLTHDLKNPLGAAYGYAELLEDEMVGPLQPEQREMIGRIKGLVTLSVTTVNDLVELYRDGSSSVQLQLMPTDVTQLVNDVATDFRARAMQSGLTLEIAPLKWPDSEQSSLPPASQTVIHTDPSRVRQILGNLVSNAIKYTPTGGHVWLSVRGPTRSESRLAIDVRDTGPGIPPVDQERIFEEFFRLPATSEIAGTGVGLAISRRFARLLGGDVTVTDWFEGGSVFTLWLPADSTGDAHSPVRVA
jgi:signal transduction histidine kinase